MSPTRVEAEDCFLARTKLTGWRQCAAPHHRLDRRVYLELTVLKLAGLVFLVLAETYLRRRQPLRAFTITHC
jgi:hypothetical protein